jgi:cellobiose-specific phosphotransferase system component IIC
MVGGKYTAKRLKTYRLKRLHINKLLITVKDKTPDRVDRAFIYILPTAAAAVAIFIVAATAAAIAATATAVATVAATAAAITAVATATAPAVVRFLFFSLANSNRSAFYVGTV